MNDGRIIRVFISSPADVIEERRRAALVLGRLKRDFARFFTISPELWEYEPMIATGTFQDVIVEPAATDIVVLILWSRLGTPLPPRTALRSYQGLDGRSPVTGTEWEFESALSASRERQARGEPATPDILVYKKDIDGIARGKTAAQLDEAVRQMVALEDFWRRYFQNPDGHFTLAFNSFTSLDSFEEQLEAHLRKLLHKQIEREGLTPATWPGDPFLGLMSFEFEHANIFFGRTSAVQEIAETLVRRAESGGAFMMVTGASGSGKSSLVKAGVLNGLFERGVVTRTAVWRRCTIRPSGAGAIADRLAVALTVDSALPELAALGVNAEQLGSELRRSEILSLKFALIEAARKAANLAADPNTAPTTASAPIGRLVLVVDQFEELFIDPGLTAGDREWFIELLIKLSCSGFVWVIATQRSDFFAQMASFPKLRDLCSGDGLYHLLAPRSEEIDQMIRLPAEAAGIAFEVDPHSGIGLDQELRSAAASNPYSLPLLEFTLDELYRRDIVARRGKALRIATYRDELRKLEGAIAARAEVVCNCLSVEAREQALPEILRALVAVGDDDKPTGRSTPLAELSATPERRKVLDALVNARLLVVHGENQSPLVGVAHEALITEWPFYSELVKKHVRFLRARGRIAAQARLWLNEKKDPSRLLAPGLALEEGRSLLERGSEVGAEIISFVEASISRAQKAERRKRRILMAIASAATVAAVIFAGLAEYARRTSVRAQSNFEAATIALSTLIKSVPKTVEPVAPLQTVSTLMDEARNAIAMFPPTEGASPKIRRYRAEISLALATIDFDLGRYADADRLADEARMTLTAVVADDPSDLESQYDLARSQHLIGTTFYQLTGSKDRDVKDDIADARAAYETSLSILDLLVHTHGNDADVWLWHVELSQIHRDYGDLLIDRVRDPASAKVQFNLAMAEIQDVRQSSHGGSAVDYYAGWTTNKLGDVLLRMGDRPGAIAEFEQARDQIATLGVHLQENKEWQNHLSIIFNNIGLLMREGGLYGEAIGQFARASELVVPLASRDPDNTDLRSVVGWTYDNSGETFMRWAKVQSENRADHLQRAREALQRAREVRVTLADMKPQWQQDLLYTAANFAAVDAIELEMNGRHLEAGDAYARAADLNQKVAAASLRDDAIKRTIEFNEWSAVAFSNGDAPERARDRLAAAIDVAQNHHSIVGTTEMTATVARLRNLLQAGQKQ